PSDALGDMMGITGWVLGSVINVSVFIIKSWLLVFVMMWVRWTLPRLRIDQVMMTCLKYLLPMSCVLLLGASLMPLLLNSSCPAALRFGRVPQAPAVSKSQEKPSTPARQAANDAPGMLGR